MLPRNRVWEAYGKHQGRLLEGRFRGALRDCSGSLAVGNRTGTRMTRNSGGGAGVRLSKVKQIGHESIKR